MKRAKIFAYIGSFMLLIPSVLMFLFFALFSKFSLPSLQVISDLNLKLLTLYFSVLFGLICLYTTYYYRKISKITPFFFFFTSAFALSNVVTTKSTMYIIYIGILSLNFAIAGFFGYNAWQSESFQKKDPNKKVKKIKKAKKAPRNKEVKLNKKEENRQALKSAEDRHEIKPVKKVRKIVVPDTGFRKRERKTDEKS